LNPCVAHYSTDSIPWVHHSREEGSLEYDGGFVHLQIYVNFDTIIYHQKTTLSNEERKEFCEFLHFLKVPSGYPSNSKRLVSVKDMKTNFNLMKSHDCHVLMKTLLPVALRCIKTKLVRDAVTSLSLFFNTIEQKVIDEEKVLDSERRHFETLCLLEATFPPS
jgi:hypothetical protein